jgi:hypothetical protein
LWLESRGRDFAKAGYLFQYGPIEDVPLGWAAEAAIGPAGPAVGSTSGSGERLHFQGSISDWSQAFGGHLLSLLATEGNIAKPADRYYWVDAVAGWIKSYGSDRTPWLTRVFAEVAWGEHLLGTEALVLGLERGLRTLGFDGMAGDQLVRANFEQGRALPFDLFGFARTGVAAFYDVGMAKFRGEDRDLADARHEIGVGFRVGAKRAGSADTARIDLTWPLDTGGGPVLTAVTRGVF